MEEMDQEEEDEQGSVNRVSPPGVKDVSDAGSKSADAERQYDRSDDR